MKPLKPFAHIGRRKANLVRTQQHAQFVERVAQGLVRPLDRYGKPLTVGDLVQWHPEKEPTCQVMAIEVLPVEQQPPDGSVGVRITIALSVPVYVDVRGTEACLVKIEKQAAPTDAANTKTPPASETPDDTTPAAG